MGLPSPAFAGSSYTDGSISSGSGHRLIVAEEKHEDMTLPVTALYAALMGLMAIWLSVGVGRLRGKTNISLYDGGNKELAAAIRKHGNFTEYVPLILILMAVIEVNGGSTVVLHGCGLGLTVGRIVHPLGIDFDEMRKMARGIGAMLTMLVFLVLSIYSLYQFFAA